MGIMKPEGEALLLVGFFVFLERAEYDDRFIPVLDRRLHVPWATYGKARMVRD